MQISTVTASADKLPFADASFDVITSMDFLIHFPNWKEMLKEQLRICKDGGRIIFNFLNGDNLDLFPGSRRDAAAFLTGGDFVAGASMREMQDFCSENGCEVVKWRPYSYFDYNVFYANNLDTKEASTLRSLLTKAMADKNVMDVMRRIDEEIISTLSPELCTRMIVMLRK